MGFRPVLCAMLAGSSIGAGICFDALCFKLRIRRPVKALRVIFSCAVISAGVGLLLLADEMQVQ